MPHVRCYCTVHSRSGALVPPHTARAHERSDLRNQSVSSQANFGRVGAHIMPIAHANEGPVLRGFAIPSCEPQPPLSPDVEFHDPPRISDSAVEQDMLDYGFLTGEDLDIMTHGGALPNLGPNFHSPEALLAAVDHFNAYNTATAAGGRPLTTHEAYRLPIDPEQRALDRQLAKVLDGY